MASEKMCKLDDHVAVAVAGINSDANLLINSARSAQQKVLLMFASNNEIQQAFCAEIRRGLLGTGPNRATGSSSL